MANAYALCQDKYTCLVCHAHMHPRNKKRHISRCCPDILEDWEEKKHIYSSFISSMKNEQEKEILEMRFGLSPKFLFQPLTIKEICLEKPRLKFASVSAIIIRTISNMPFACDVTHSLEVLFEDESILVVNKPPRLRVSPSHRLEGESLLNRVLGYLSLSSTSSSTVSTSTSLTSSAPLNAVSQVQLLHRLDTDTSGAVMFAKNEKAANFLLQQFRSHTVKKEYLAICQGEFDASLTRGGVLSVGASFIIDAPIGSCSDPDFYVHEQAICEDGKEAITQIEVLAVQPRDGGGHSVALRVLPVTGRTHQIRVHLASIGLPLVYDPVYRSKATTSGSLQSPLQTSNDEKNDQVNITYGRFTAKALEERGIRSASSTTAGRTRRPVNTSEHRQCLHAGRIEFCHPKTELSTHVVAPLPQDMLQVLTDLCLELV